MFNDFDPDTQRNLKALGYELHYACDLQEGDQIAYQRRPTRAERAENNYGAIATVLTLGGARNVQHQTVVEREGRYGDGEVVATRSVVRAIVDTSDGLSWAFAAHEAIALWILREDQAEVLPSDFDVSTLVD